MANIKSAQKRVRQTKVRTERNKAVKTRVRSAFRNLQESIEAGKADDIKTALSSYTSQVDKAYKNNLFHKNKAANLKAKAAKAAKAVSA